MFVEAIDTATTFTRAIHSISRNYGSNIVQPSAATLFFVNSDGWALTCGHVAKLVPLSEEVTKQYQAFKGELAAQKGEKKEKVLRRELEKKYKYSKEITVELRNRFMGCVKGAGVKIEARFHGSLDIALIKFDSYEQLACHKFPVFPKDTTGLKQGLFLCRLGFPFAEFTNFDYDEAGDTTNWTTTGLSTTPQFPIEGMMTRRLKDGAGEIVGFEMSTPGLRGQSGGPVFDTEGKVWGMQSQTHHLDLNFDIDKVEVVRGGLPKKVSNTPFLHVGHCVHVDALKAFMREQGVHFDEA